jgi:hypothetical protein
MMRNCVGEHMNTTIIGAWVAAESTPIFHPLRDTACVVGVGGSAKSCRFTQIRYIIYKMNIIVVFYEVQEIVMYTTGPIYLGEHRMMEGEFKKPRRG